MSDSTGSEEATRRELMELSQFVLNRKTTDTRKELYEHLVAFTLSRHEGTDGLTLEEIVASLESDYAIKRIPSHIVNETLDSLRKMDHVRSVVAARGSEYFLTTQKSREISEMIKSYDNIRSQVVDRFVATVTQDSQNIATSNRKQLVDAFYTTLGILFARNGIACARALTGTADSAGQPTELAEFSKIVEEGAQALTEVPLRHAFVRQFREFMSSPSGEAARLLFSLAQSYAIAQTLNLDPQLATLEQQALSKRLVYLDTNLVVSLMCIGQLHEPVVKLVELTRQLGIRMVFSKKTRYEFMDLLGTAEQRLGLKTANIPVTVASKAIDLMQDPFIKSFWMELKAGSNESWDGFLAKMRAFDGLLKHRNGIEEDDQIRKEIVQHSEISRLTTEVLAAASPGKNETAAEHDAYHLLLVRELRKLQQTDELGPAYWFLTRDCTLQQAEFQYNAQEITSSIMIDAWLAMISPLLSPQVVAQEAAEAFSQILSSQLPQITESVNPDDLIGIMGPWIDIADLETEDLRRIVGDHHVRQCLESIRQGTREQNKTKVKESLEGLMEKITKYVDAKHNRQTESLEEKIRTLEDKVKSRRISWGLLCVGLVLVGCLFSLPFLEAYTGVSIPNILYQSLTLLVALFVAAAFLGRSVLSFFFKGSSG